MAEKEIIISLPISQVTKITSKGTYQLVDPNPLFLEKTIINVDITLIDGLVTLILPQSSVYKFGQSQQFIFQTTGATELVLPAFIIKTYVYEERQEPDRLNSKPDGSIDDFGKDGTWYSLQLISDNRWSSTLI